MAGMQHKPVGSARLAALDEDHGAREPPPPAARCASCKLSKVRSSEMCALTA